MTTVHPATSIGDGTPSIETLINEELYKARTKFPSPNRCFAALVEEVGELAQALLKADSEGGKTADDVRSEAIQVAVMAIRVATEGSAEFPNVTRRILDTWRGY